MILVEELQKLHELQKVDYQIYQRAVALKALDSGETLKQTAIALMKRHDAAAAEQQKREGDLRDRELELRTVEEKRKKVHDKLYSGKVTNPKELGDLQKDEVMLDTQIGTIEEAVLGLMDAAEEAKTVTTTLAGELAAAKRKWQETVAHTQAETARLQKEIAALRPERERLAAPVDKQLLRRYEDIMKTREGVGLAMTANDTCPACHMRLSTTTLLRLREGEELVNCESCGRILGWLA